MSSRYDENRKYLLNYLLCTEEDITKYRRGGYHPVSIDDTFKDDRYKIFNKLGFGGSSTVWLAFDLWSDKFVALKIMTAEKSIDSQELSMHQHLANLPQAGALSPFVVQLQDHFFHEGPNGNHLCLVTELLGPSLSAISEKYHDKDTWFESETVFNISEKLLMALNTFHTTGLAHGDLNMRNFVFTCHRLLENNLEEVDDQIGTPYTEEMVRKDGMPLEPSVPKNYVQSETWDDWNDETVEDIKIIDFGEAFRDMRSSALCRVPSNYRPPEVIFEEYFDYRIDLWLAGFAIYTLAYRSFPFEDFALGDDGTNMLVMTIMRKLGDLPKEWIPRWKSIQTSWTGSDPLDPENSNGVCSNPVWYGGKVQIPKDISRVLEPVTRVLLTYKMSNRVSASQALQLLRTLRAKR